MMRKIRYITAQVWCCIFLCAILAGCSAHDSAIVIPIGEAEEESDAAIAGTEMPEGEATQNMYSDGAEQNETPGESEKLIYVYVCGAVVNPGVVELPEGSRADDALQAAGGFAEDAHREYVNLAAKVADGEKLYFPTIEEAEELEAAADAMRSGLVDINAADAALLMTLPGIGEARARDIIDYREQNGDFLTEEDLQKVPGIKENMYAKLRDKIIVQ